MSSAAQGIHKQKRKRKGPNAKRSCLNCSKAHLSCSNQRPCTRCIAKGIECTEKPMWGLPASIPMSVPQSPQPFVNSSTSGIVSISTPSLLSSHAPSQPHFHNQQQLQLVSKQIVNSRPMSPLGALFQSNNSTPSSTTSSSSSSGSNLFNAPSTNQSFDEADISKRLLQIIQANASMLGPMPESTTTKPGAFSQSKSSSPQLGLVSSSPAESFGYSCSHESGDFDFKFDTTLVHNYTVKELPTSIIHDIYKRKTTTVMQEIETLELILKSKRQELQALHSYKLPLKSCSLQTPSTLDLEMQLPNIALRVLETLDAEVTLWDRKTLLFVRGNETFKKSQKFQRNKLFSISGACNIFDLFFYPCHPVFKKLVCAMADPSQDAVYKYWDSVQLKDKYGNVHNITYTTYIDKDLMAVVTTKHVTNGSDNVTADDVDDIEFADLTGFEFIINEFRFNESPVYSTSNKATKTTFKAQAFQEFMDSHRLAKKESVSFEGTQTAFEYSK